MAELQDPVENKESFISRALGAIGLRSGYVALLVIFTFAGMAFGLYLYLNPSGKAAETRLETPAAQKPKKTKSDETYEALEETVNVIVRAGGVVRAAKTTKIYSPVDGKLTGVTAAIGSKVTSNTILAKVDTGLLQKKIARAEVVYNLAKAELALAKTSSEAKPEDINFAQLSADVALADLETARMELGAAEIKIPTSGLIDTINISEGQVVSSGQLLAEIVNPNDFILETWVTHSDALALHVDATASVQFTAQQDNLYTASVTSIGYAAQQHSGSANEVPVILRFAPDQKLDWIRVGLRGADVEIPTVKRVLPVPRTAVVSQGDQHVIFVKSKSGFVPRAVKIGLFDDEMIEVLEGLEEGESVAVN